MPGNGVGCGLTFSALGRTALIPLRQFQIQPETLKRVAALAPEVDEQYVKDRSPLCPETQTPATFLQWLYRFGETVLVFDRRQSQGVLCVCAEGPSDAGCLDHLIHGCKDGVWFLCNPVGGKLQELLYLDPEPDGTPIVARPTRQQVYQEWMAKRQNKEGA